MANRIQFCISALFLGFVALSCANNYIEEEIAAYHFHVYIFDVNPRHVDEALTFRRKTRQLIEERVLDECSLNRIVKGWDGPHPFSQYELCCNKTSFAVASSFHIQNHGNLSVLIHPLTIYDKEDHIGRAGWIGDPVPLDLETPFLFDVLDHPRPCPVYDYYADVMPSSPLSYLSEPLPPPGTEDYRNISGFNMLSGNY